MSQLGAEVESLKKFKEKLRTKMYDFSIKE